MENDRVNGQSTDGTTKSLCFADAGALQAHANVPRLTVDDCCIDFVVFTTHAKLLLVVILGWLFCHLGNWGIHR